LSELLFRNDGYESSILEFLSKGIIWSAHYLSDGLELLCMENRDLSLDYLTPFIDDGLYGKFYPKAGSKLFD